MQFSKVLCATALVVVGSLVLVSAGQYGGGYNQNNAGRYGKSNSGGYGQSNGALMHYGGGGCGGRGCYGGASSAPAHSSQNKYGPYHSYAVRPAIYGGHGMYTYKGYARHQPAPAALYRRARSYSMPAPSRHYGASHNAGSRHYGGAASSQMAGYSMRPVKALALVHGNNYQQARPSYHRQQHQQQTGGHYRATRGAYGSGRAKASYQQRPQRHYQQQQQSHGSGYGSSSAASSQYGGSSYGAGNRNSYAKSQGGHGGY